MNKHIVQGRPPRLLEPCSLVASRSRSRSLSYDVDCRESRFPTFPTRNPADTLHSTQLRLYTALEQGAISAAPTGSNRGSVATRHSLHQLARGQSSHFGYKTLEGITSVGVTPVSKHMNL